MSGPPDMSSTTTEQVRWRYLKAGEASLEVNYGPDKSGGGTELV
jgi:hypothetical protein